MKVSRTVDVAMVADVLAGDQMGGVKRSVIGLAQALSALDARDLRLTVLARRPPSDEIGVPVHHSFSPRVPRLPKGPFALQRPLTLRRYDVVHYVDSRPPFTLGLARRPSIVTQHGFATLAFPEWSRRSYRTLDSALVHVAAYAGLTITASESERCELIARAQVEPESVRAIHHGIDHELFRPPPSVSEAQEAVSEALGVSGPYVLYVSNHQRKKNPEGLVDAFARIADAWPQLSLVMTGWHTPDFQRVWDRINATGLQHRVRPVGHVPEALLPSLYGGAHVFCLPSYHEGFGFPALEAMACGAPVVASRTSSLGEVCGDAAELVDPASIDSIAAGLNRVLADDGYRAELRRRGFDQASKFTWQRAAELHLDCYREAAGSRPVNGSA